LNDGIKSDPASPQMLAPRGRLKRQLKDYKASLADYSRAIEDEPTSKYYRERAEVHSLLGDKELAAQELRSADK
jgi:regulator of sirC expression with transglutaminase-like and TPR domain